MSSHSTLPLNGIKIIDFTNMLMAPYATQILGDMGADVIKVEAPGGDPVRLIGPARNQGMGAIFINCNRSKRSIVLNVKHRDGHKALMDLVATADVLVYNRRPQVMKRLRLSYKAVKAVNQSIIYAGLFGYGQDGPYASKPAFDDLIQGAIAVPWLAHMADGREPTYAPTAIVDRGVGLWAVGQINAALFHRARTGEGQRIDMPMFEMMASFVLSDHMSGRTFEPSIGSPGYPRMLNPNRRPYPTRDGYICVMIYTDLHWKTFFKVLDREAEFNNDSRFATMATRTEHIAAIYSELAEILTMRTTAEWMKLFEAEDIPAMPLHTLESLIGDEHLAQVKFFQSTEHPSEGRLYDMAYPSTWSTTQPKASRLAPRLGEHSIEILRELNYDEAKIVDLVAKNITKSAK